MPKSPPSFDLRCPYCGHNGRIDINLNDLDGINCSECESDFTARQAADDTADTARRWMAVARWVKAHKLYLSVALESAVPAPK
jgi:hypothetical protein